MVKPVNYKGILIIIFGIYTRCQQMKINVGVGLGVAFFATGPGLGLIMYILTTLEFPTRNIDFHLLTTSLHAKYQYLFFNGLSQKTTETPFQTLVMKCFRGNMPADTQSQPLCRRINSILAPPLYFRRTFCPSFYLQCLENYRENTLKVFVLFQDCFGSFLNFFR